MAVGIAAGMVFLFYLLAIPVEFALVICSKPKPGFGTGISVFENRFALHSAQKRASGEKKHLPWKKAELDFSKFSSLRALKYTVRHLRVEKLQLRGSIGMQDAAVTALICGFARALGCALTPMEKTQQITISLQPDFACRGCELELCGMVSMRAGHIICTALIGALHSIKGRISQWKSTRLKTSWQRPWIPSATWWM